MAAIATANIFDMGQFGNMAFDGCHSSVAQFCQFFSRNFRILSYLIFYPNIKFDFLGDILSATLSIILSITLSNIKS